MQLLSFTLFNLDWTACNRYLYHSQKLILRFKTHITVSVLFLLLFADGMTSVVSHQNYRRSILGELLCF